MHTAGGGDDSLRPLLSSIAHRSPRTPSRTATAAGTRRGGPARSGARSAWPACSPVSVADAWAPSTFRGAPTGQALRGTARRPEGDEDRAAARLLRRRHPVLPGVLVPLAHRAGRSRTGRTIHFELLPDGS